MNSARLAVLLCTPLVALLLPVYAHALSPADILRLAVKADGHVAYTAEVEIGVYAGGHQVGVHVQRITKAPVNRRRVESLGRKGGGVIVSNGREEWEYRNGQPEARVRELSSPDDILRWRLAALDAVAGTLHPVYEGQATIAKRRCHVIAVKPPDGERTRKRVWIDREKYVELKTIRYSPAGGIQATWTVKSICYDPRISSSVFEFRPPEGTRVRRIPRAPRMNLSSAEQRVGFDAVVPDYLPDGYVLLREQVGVLPGPGGGGLWLQFTDGVDSFSLFQNRGGGPPPPRGGHGVTSWQARGRSFVLVGPVSREDTERIKRSTMD